MNIRTRLYLSLAVLLACAGITGWSADPAAQASPSADTGIINITAKRFTFEPSEVHLKKGVTVTLHVTSQDVMHGLFVRPLKIDSDIPAGQSVDLKVTPQAAGKFTAICDHFCGSGHGNMKMTFIVDE